MPIEVTNQEEKLTYEYEDAKIYYRRMGKPRLNFIQKKHTKRGVVDWSAVTDEVLRETVLGWNEKIQHKGKPLPFSPDMIIGLPLPVQNDLSDRIIGEGAYHGEETPEKNSKTSSSGS